VADVRAAEAAGASFGFEIVAGALVEVDFLVFAFVLFRVGAGLLREYGQVQ
jgi:hypothetical protein